MSKHAERNIKLRQLQEAIERAKEKPKNEVHLGPEETCEYCR